MNYVHYYPRALVGNGGPTVAVWGWVRALQEAGQAVSVVCDSDMVGPQSLVVSHVPVFPVSHVFHGRWRLPVGLGPHLSTNTVLIVHSAFLLGNLVAACVAARVGAKTVFTPHGAYQREARQRRAFVKTIWLSIERAIVERSLAVHAFVSTEVASIRQVLPCVPIVVAPTPITIPASSPWRGGGGYIAWFGRYDIAHKGLDLLVEAYRRVPVELRIPMRLHGRDSTNTRSDVLALVTRVGLSDVISVGGPIEGDAKVGFLTSAEFVVMPSRWESFSIALLEALALNVPGIISDTMPIAGQLREERACIVSSTNPDALAATISHVLLHRQEMTASVFPLRFVQRTLTHEAAGQCFVQHIEALCE